MCVTLTSNVSRAGIPGNVLLMKGEANLSKPSVITISQIITVNKSDLKNKIGHLSDKRIREVLAGLHQITNVKN
jgi:mRNA interferase MazF